MPCHSGDGHRDVGLGGYRSDGRRDGTWRGRNDGRNLTFAEALWSSELRLRDGSHAGVAFQPFGWIVHQSRSRTGYGGATGLVRTLIWPFIFKNYSVRDLAEFLEVYGLPMKVGKYPSGFS